MTRAEWARLLAAELGNTNPAPGVLRFIAAWTKAEGGSAKYNPTNTTLNWPGATWYNTFGSQGQYHVKNYPGLEAGIMATVATLSGQFPGYADIRQGIIRNDPIQSIRGLIASPWGTDGSLVDRIFHGSQQFEGEPLPGVPDAYKSGDPADAAMERKWIETAWSGPKLYAGLSKDGQTKYLFTKKAAISYSYTTKEVELLEAGEMLGMRMIEKGEITRL